MKTPFYLPHVLRGFEGDDDTGDDAIDDSTDDSTDESTTVPDAEAIAARAAARAKRKAKREQAEELGFSSVKEMTEFFTNAKQEADQRKTEEEQRQEALRQREKQLEQRDAEIRTKAMKLTIREALAETGINPKRLAQAEVLVTSTLRSEDMEDDEDIDSIIKEAVTNLKTDTPEWFGKQVAFGSNDGSDEGEGAAEKSEQQKLQAKIRQDLERRGMTFQS